ncbi:MAG: asparagine--tRNA ligase [Nanoarchaeota archaeon]|nr:asparagine--tRNA ligase [Nanoarchaeota archaeon]
MKQEFISIQKALKQGKGKVSLRGWVYRIRKGKDKIFIILRDTSDIIQCVFSQEKFKKQWNAIDKILIESSIKIKGTIKQDKRAVTGYEIQVEEFEIISYAEDFPIGKDQSQELLLDKRHLWIRSRRMQAILKIRSTVFGAIHEYFRSKEFYEFQSPIITSGAAESGPTKFTVDYFGKKVFLTQTWQFYAEAAIYALEKIYTIAPSFRAEESKTSRHLTEYWHAEAEVAWTNLDELIDIAENLVKYVITKVLKENKKELAILGRDINKLEPSTKKKFPRITYANALKLLKDKKKINIKWGKDLRTIEEEKIMELYDTPIFVTNYPKDCMAFYKPRSKKNRKTAECFDCLLPEGNGELIGGSERDISIEEIKKSLKFWKEKIEDYEFYMEPLHYGAIPHAGFGLGIERFIKWICGLDNIKDAIAFPRTMTRYSP